MFKIENVCNLFLKYNVQHVFNTQFHKKCKHKYSVIYLSLAIYLGCSFTDIKLIHKFIYVFYILMTNAGVNYSINIYIYARLFKSAGILN